MAGEPGRYALVFFPDLEDPRLDAFRRRYDPWSDRIAGHVTLVHPSPDPSIAWPWSSP